MKLSEAVYKRLQVVMKEKGFSFYTLHKQGGIPKSTLSRVLNGNVERIELPTLYEILATMQVSLGEFFSDNLFELVTD